MIKFLKKMWIRMTGDIPVECKNCGWVGRPKDRLMGYFYWECPKCLHNVGNYPGKRYNE